MSATQHFTAITTEEAGYFHDESTDSESWSGTSKVNLKDYEDIEDEEGNILELKWTTLDGYNADSTEARTPEGIAKSRELAYKLYYNLESINALVKVEVFMEGLERVYELPSDLIISEMLDGDAGDFEGSPSGDPIQPYMRVAKTPYSDYYKADEDFVAGVNATVRAKFYRLYVDDKTDEANFIGFGAYIFDGDSQTALFSLTELDIDCLSLQSINPGEPGQSIRTETSYVSLDAEGDTYHFVQSASVMNVPDGFGWTSVIEDLHVSQSVEDADACEIEITSLNFYTYT